MLKRKKDLNILYISIYMDTITDEYLNLYIQLNYGLKIKNIVKGGKEILINDKNKDKVKNILNKRLQILKQIEEATGKIARKQKQIEPLQQLVSKVDKVRQTFKKTLKAISKSKSIKKFETKAKQFLERRRQQRQPAIKERIPMREILNKKFAKFQYETIRVNDIQQYFNLINGVVLNDATIKFVSVLFSTSKSNK